MSRIISDRNYERVVGLLKETRGKVAHGGQRDKAERYIQPTVITDVTMQGGFYVNPTDSDTSLAPSSPPGGRR